MSISFIYPNYLWLLLLLPLTLGLGWLNKRHLPPPRLWASLVLRTLLLILLILVLAGIQLRLRSKLLTTVFILDVSDSISSEERARGEAFIRQAIQKMPGGDQAAIVMFGEDALVERLASEERTLPEFTSIPIRTRTDIFSALQLAQTILPYEGAKRLVLLSDGRENLRNAIEQAELAAAQDIQLLYLPLGSPPSDAEVLIESLEAPSDIRQGEDFYLTAILHSTTSANALLRIFADGNLMSAQELHLHTGTNRVQMTVNSSQIKSQTSGFHRFSAQIIPDVDTQLQNNSASAFIVVHGPPQVLVVEGSSDEGENFIRALQAAEIQVVRKPPEELPTTLTELTNYQAIVFVNVNSARLPSGLMDILPVYVRDLGMGFIMIGGQESFGAGGYLRTPLEEALPVDMDVRDKQLQANLALILAVDKSGSMGRCHCDNPDLNQSYTRREVGQPKVDIAKAAIMQAARALGNQDYLGVVAFDNSAKWALRISPLVDATTLEQAIGTFQAEGSTNLQAGVQAAYEALQDVPAKRKHIILMTDGWVRQGDLTPLAQQMSSQGITLSIVAAGEGSAQYLASLAQVGGGRYYPATDVLSVPQIFLKETIKSAGEYIVEEPFYPIPSAPSAILRNLDVANLPALLGYNGSTAKKTARLELITSRGDPLLATWQYGLGRSAVWTSDLKAQWAAQWLKWDGFSRFAVQLVKWVLPTPHQEGLEAKAFLKDAQSMITLQAIDKGGNPLNFLDITATVVDPDLVSKELVLKQSGPGEYQVSFRPSQQGTYLIRLGINQKDQSLGQMTLGLIVPYSPEYKVSGIDRALLSKISNITGGGEVQDPSEVFAHNLPATDYAKEIWRPLLLLIILLFPLDVAVRRLVFTRYDWLKFQARLLSYIPRKQTTEREQPRLLGQLFQARDRARARQSSHREELPQPVFQQTSETQAPRGEILETKPREPSSPAQAPQPPGDALSRLHEAKRRAHKKMK